MGYKIPVPGMKALEVDITATCHCPLVDLRRG